MNKKKFRISVYIVTAVVILIFFTKDIDLRSKFYKNIITITDPDDLLVLVNKNNQLPSNYIPSNLEMINQEFAHEGKQLIKEAKINFESLGANAKILGYNIVAVSAYRDYDYQNKLYEGYVSVEGLAYADNCCARAGHSEHQTGLAVDVAGSNDDYNEFDKSPEFRWMRDNAHLFGFIMRYPKGKEHITGFKYEPWHYRYVGVEAAKIIFKEKLTLEEYHEIYISNRID